MSTCVQYCELAEVDAQFQWMGDRERIGKRQGGDLDHFKECGHLCFWLRRSKVFLDCAPIGNGREIDDELKDVVLVYPHEYVAFDISFRICRYFVAKREGQRRRMKILPTT